MVLSGSWREWGDLPQDEQTYQMRVLARRICPAQVMMEDEGFLIVSIDVVCNIAAEDGAAPYLMRCTVAAKGRIVMMIVGCDYFRMRHDTRFNEMFEEVAKQLRAIKWD